MISGFAVTTDEYLALLSLLQLVSPALPVGAYSYSEGLEALCDIGAIKDAPSLKHWLERELYCGAVRLEAAVMLRAYRAVKSNDLGNLTYWNNWLSAARETEELRLQSWQMGYSLLRLLQDMQVAAADEACMQLIRSLQQNREGSGCNFAIAFGLAASIWGIAAQPATLGYLHSWVANLIGAGVKLIPLGQTAGQHLIASLHAEVSDAARVVQNLDDDDLQSCGWGLALASMAHETQYSRLFRS